MAATWLSAMRAVVDPFARRRDPLAGRNDGGEPDHGDEIAMTSRFDPQNAKSSLTVVKRYPLDQTRQHFRRLTIGLGFHDWRARFVAPR
ncbi:MAG: hypothetical protein P4L82_09640 [Ancalomicrobiaceae bacterium]|nr:hypothetical protein [Ancalomicrobiaceae bacterium]